MKSAAERDRFEGETGARYSPLAKLPYYNMITMLAIDPMHCLFLGTGKHLLKTYIERGILSAESLKKVTHFLQEARKKAPEEVGRIPRTILEVEDIDNLTADEMKNFLLSFAIPILHDFLPDQDYEILKDFVRGCVFLSTRVLPQGDLERADQFLLSFCEGAEKLYGSSFCTPNMHMQLHVADSIENFGPVYSFWLFGFERFNGLLGSFYSSNRCVEEEIMRKFSQNTLLNAVEVEPSHHSLINPVRNKEQKGSLQSEVLSEDSFLAYIESFDPSTLFLTSDPFGIPEGKKMFEKFNEQMAGILYEFYSKNFSEGNSSVFFKHDNVTVFHTLRVGSERFDSVSQKTNRSFVLASFESGGYTRIYPAQILMFFQHNIKEDGKIIPFTFAVVQFFKPGRGTLGSFPHDPEGLEHLWNIEDRYLLNWQSMLPAQRIICSFVSEL